MRDVVELWDYITEKLPDNAIVKTYALRWDQMDEMMKEMDIQGEQEKERLKLVESYLLDLEMALQHAKLL
jgi:hypothetical protein